MNGEETSRLCMLVSTVCPQQRMVPAGEGEPGTAAVWFAILQDVRFQDATEAVKRIARRQPFIAPADIVAEVKLIRGERLAALPEAARPTPNVDPKNSVAYAAELRAIGQAVADGRMGPEQVRAYASGGVTLTGVKPMLAIGPGASGVTRGVDVSRVFKPVPRPVAERARREDEEASRAKALKALDEWAVRQQARKDAKRRRARAARPADPAD